MNETASPTQSATSPAALQGWPIEHCPDDLDLLGGHTGFRVEVSAVDMNSLQSLRKAAVDCKSMSEARGESLQGFICNAAVQSNGPVTYSSDNYKDTFAINCLGHFLLVDLLVNSIAPGRRVLWTSSGTRDRGCYETRRAPLIFTDR